MTWPDPPAAGPLGDGRFATASDRPNTLDELRHAVATRAGEGLAVYPQGGRTALDFGGPPRRPGAAVDTRALDRVVDYPYADMTITVEAGVTVAALTATLDAQGQRLLIDVPDPGRATIGAVYATNTCGPRRFGAGGPRDQVLGVGFVNAEGELIRGGGRVVKNVAGYDFPRLLTGSMGTLGVIAEMTLKVRPKPEASAIVWAVVNHIDDLGPLLDRVNTSASRPIAVEVLSPLAAGLVGQGQHLPVGWVLAVGLEDNSESVAWQTDRLREELALPLIEVRHDAASEPIWSALTAFQAAPVGTLSVAANLRPSGVAAFLRELDPERWSAQAHAGNGIVRAHLAAGSDLETVGREIDRLRALAVQGGGNLVVPRCPTDWKPRLKVWGEPRADWDIAERIKHALDPGAVMNPGRFVGTI